MPTSTDIVQTRDEARGLERPPLLVLDALERFLDDHGLGAGPLSAAPIGDGHSNPTFALRRGADRFVLRRPPRPPLPPSTHDVLREHRVTAALAHTDVRVPTPLVACAEDAVIGAPFYVMEHLDAVAMATAIPVALDTPAARARIADELVDALAQLHLADWRGVGLGDFGRPEGFLERQVARFTDLWARNRTREIATVEEVGRRLAAATPSPQRASVVHGDYRLGNVMYAATAPARLVAIVDWELASIGDPLADVGYLLSSYAEPGEDPGVLSAIASLTQREGFPARARLAARYEAATGLRVDGIAWYQALAHWKLAVILEGSYRRLLAGSTDDPWLRGMREAVPELAERALAVLEAS